jgi:hypothetical protein
MKRAILNSTLIALMIILSACAVTPQKRFPEFYAKTAHPENIDILIDTIILSDLSGSDIGVDRAKNQVAMTLIKSGIDKSFTDRGFKPNIVLNGNGLTYEMNEKEKYFYATDWTSSEEEYTGPIFSEEDKKWGGEDIRKFLIKLDTQASLPPPKKSKSVSKKSRSAKKSQSQKIKPQDTFTPITTEDVPPAILELPSNLFVYARLTGAEVGMSKTVGTAVATGILSAVLTGGMYVSSSAPASGSNLKVIVFDKSSLQVVWHNSAPGTKFDTVHKIPEAVLAAFPKTNGEQLKPVTRTSSKRSSSKKTSQSDS